MVFSSDETFDISAEFSEDLHIDTNTCNILIQKANCYIKFKAYLLLLFLEYSLK